MKKLIIEHISYSLLLGLLLPSWHVLYAPEHAQPANHKQKPLITTVSKTYRKNNVSLQVNVLDKSEIPYLFQFPATFLYNLALADDIVPIQITIKNNSKENCFIDPKDIEGTILSYQDMVNLSKKNNWKKSNKYRIQKKIIGITGIIGSVLGGLTGFFLSALAFSGYVLPFAATWTLMGIGIGFMAGILYCGIYGAFWFTIGQWIKSLIHNIRIKKMIKKNTLYKRVTIKPGEEYSTCIFLVQPNNMVPSIAIHHNTKDQRLTHFDLDSFYTLSP